MQEESKQILDAASVGIAVSSLASWLPPAAALVTVVWTSIRIYETKTVQGWITKKQKND